MKLENFAILVRVKGATGQLVLTTEEHHLFSQLIIGTLTDAHGKAEYVATPSVHLPANPKVFPQ